MKSLPTMGWRAKESSSPARPANLNAFILLSFSCDCELCFLNTNYTSVHINGILSGPSNIEAFFLSCTGCRVIFYCFRLCRCAIPTTGFGLTLEGGPGIRYHCPGPKRKSHRGKYNKTHRGRIKLSNSCESAPNCWPFVGSLKWKAEGKGVGLS